MEIDFIDDPDTNKLLTITIHFLQTYFDYSDMEAVDMLRQYYDQWRHVHDDDFYHHIGAYGTAVRVHYFIGLSGAQSGFPDWRRENNYNKTPGEALDYFRKHYFEK